METGNLTAPEIKNRLTKLYTQRAEIYVQLKEYEKSIEDIKQVYLLNGSVQPGLYFQLAVCYRNTGEYGKAMGSVNQAIMMSDECSSEYLIERGLLYYNIGKYDFAITDLLEGLKNFACHPEANRILALSFDKLGNIPETMEYMLLAAEQGDEIAKEYIKNLGYFAVTECQELFNNQLSGKPRSQTERATD